MNDTKQQLDQIRQAIDSIDQEIQALVVKRAECVKTVGDIKQKAGDEALFYRPEREAKVLRKIMDRDCGRMQPKTMAEIFRSIMSACLALQQPMDVAYLGPKGTFSQTASQKHFGASVNLHPTKNIKEVFNLVAHRKAHYGVVPIENSTTGLINLTLDAFIETNVAICGEVNVLVQQYFLCKDEQAKNIEKIYSHQQSFMQCAKWLKTHYPNADQIALTSNAMAAERAAKEANTAAIASSLCAKEYDLHIINENIQDQVDNTTRFLVIGFNQPDPSDDDRTTLLVTVNNTPGALERLINPFSQNGINLTMIRSRPAPYESEKYVFFLDVDAHQEQENFKKALKDLANEPMLIKILGSYPKAVL